MADDWLLNTKRTLEHACEELVASDADDIRDLFSPLADAIAPPPDRVHAAALSALLLSVCRKTVLALHDRRAPATCTCAAMCWSWLGRFATWDDAEPLVAFREWTDAFLEQYAHQHPPSAGTRAAALIRQAPARAWTLTALARAVHTSPRRLRHDFHSHFGMRPAEYVHLVRAARAVVLFGSATKVESVAWEVGYRSKKDLYAALRRWVGSTPGELRALPGAERTWLERTLRITCVRGPGASSGLPA